MQGIRRFDVYGGRDGVGDVRTAARLFKIPKVADNAGRANIVMPGRLLVQCVAGNNSAFDAASAADTTGTPGRKIVGLIMTVCDLRGRRLDQQILQTTEEGAVLVVPALRATFCGLEDGVGGNMADSGGYASIILGTATGTDQKYETNYFTPMPNDKIDSSTIASGTATNRALEIVGPVADITNLSGQPRVWAFNITSAFAVDLV